MIDHEPDMKLKDYALGAFSTLAFIGFMDMATYSFSDGKFRLIKWTLTAIFG